MAARRLGVSEARRLLPKIVESIARDGGRVDITHRGEPKVSILRVSDIRRGSKRRGEQQALPPALRVELLSSGDLVEAIRTLRSRQKYPRRDLLVDVDSVSHPKTKSGRRRPK
jgi:hypothetical protein